MHGWMAWDEGMGGTDGRMEGRVMKLKTRY